MTDQSGLEVVVEEVEVHSLEHAMAEKEVGMQLEQKSQVVVVEEVEEPCCPILTGETQVVEVEEETYSLCQ